MKPPPFSIRGVRVVRDGRIVLDRVDLTIGSGEFVALLGPNGVGKSTLIAAMLGLLPISEGRIEIFGADLHRFRDWRRIGYVPQRPPAVGVPASLLEVTLLGRLSSRRLVGGYGKEDREAAERALATVGLRDRAGDLAANLSGGQQQRLRVARALASEPDVLVLDEPFSWVDVQTEADLIGALTNFRSGGGTVLFVAHDLHELEHLVDRVVVLRSGAVVADGPPGSVAIPELDHRHEHEPHGPTS